MGTSATVHTTDSELIPCICPSDDITTPRLQLLGECGVFPRLSRSAGCAPSAGVIHNLATPWLRGSHLYPHCSLPPTTHPVWESPCTPPPSHLFPSPLFLPPSRGATMSWITRADRRAAREPWDKKNKKSLSCGAAMLSLCGMDRSVRRLKSGPDDIARSAAPTFGGVQGVPPTQSLR